MRAILSVYDKTGIVDFARGLEDLGWELFSTGGTMQEVRKAGVSVASVTDLTDSPEMLGGRVKTLHPMVHGGLLYRRGHLEDEADVESYGVQAIDLVAGNLYPFADTAGKDDATLDDVLDQIDIGGPTMIRAAAKNYPSVIPIIDPADYSAVLESLRGGTLGNDERRALAAKAFAHIAHYDTLVSQYFRGKDDPLPAQLTIAMTRRQELRYGENPHQSGAFYTLDSVTSRLEGVGDYTQHHGREMSFVNVLDADAAYNLVADFEQPAIAIIKHTNPCCFATGHVDSKVGITVASLYERALGDGDHVSAYGGIVATNRPIDMEYASALRELRSPGSGERMFYEIVIAPDSDPDALEHLKRKSKDLRILTAPNLEPRRPRLDFRSVRDAVLVQDADVSDETKFEVVTDRQPTDSEFTDLKVAWKLSKHVKSNAVVLVNDGVLVGMGAGQPNRVASAHLAGESARDRAIGAVAASDALIPFPDTVEVCAQYGATCVMHTGGSIRDDESVVVADRLGISLLTTGVRHFRH